MSPSWVELGISVSNWHLGRSRILVSTNHRELPCAPGKEMLSLKVLGLSGHTHKSTCFPEDLTCLLVASRDLPTESFFWIPVFYLHAHRTPQTTFPLSTVFALPQQLNIVSLRGILLPPPRLSPSAVSDPCQNSSQQIRLFLVEGDSGC